MTESEWRGKTTQQIKGLHEALVFFCKLGLAVVIGFSTVFGGWCIGMSIWILKHEQSHPAPQHHVCSIQSTATAAMIK